MADPHSTDVPRAGGGLPDPDRDAKVDGLLLAGLEHYFAGRFQEAINVWGRVLFLDRGHARARAYIERARSALAEQQRRSEQLVQEGVAAMQRGDNDAARELLASAAETGEASEPALAHLEHLSRLAGAAPSTRGPRFVRRVRHAPATPPRSGMEAPAPRPVRALPLMALAAAGIVVVMLAASYDLFRPLVEAPWGRSPAPAPAVVSPEPLPVPRMAELVLARARTLFASGHLRDALGVLDGIPSADPAFAEAQRLRAEIQRALLAAAGLPVDQAVAPPRGASE